MWLRASTDSGVGEPMHASLRAAVPGGRPRLVGLLLPVVAGVLLAACSSGPPKPTEEPPQPETSAPPAAGKSGAAPAGKAGAPGTPGAPGAAPPVPVAVTARGKADFDRAVGFMRAGNTTEAELEFKQVALQFPQLSSPYVNLGILYRKSCRLDQSEAALKTAVERNDASAVAWTELGATQRMRGEFPDAAASYEKAIADDPNFAPAYRNLGVVTDLYLSDPERALTAFEKYKELTGEEKPVSGWIAELRVRTGKPPLKRPSAPPADSGQGGSGAPAGAPPGNGASQDAPAQGQKPADSKGAQPAAAPPPKAGE
jgi:hypothetical protein